MEFGAIVVGSSSAICFARSRGEESPAPKERVEEEREVLWRLIGREEVIVVGCVEGEKVGKEIETEIKTCFRFREERQFGENF
ncbi:hypothetical protein RHMOL_Rhmol03G0157600 [Rhododendron molle]|uniref:Uncharacterized protein n=1 Tax=Rhododendron molle TaxID=49168 RepID=A0ACC0PG46_RHOML|nr:hypothetical protein RHMOL_Rhmol03G0157600 [Rhododendron molle]